MRRIILIALILGAAALSAASAQTPAPDTAPSLSVQQLMKHMLNPAADAYWAASGIVETEDGATNRAPVDDTRWAAQANHAAVILEAGNALVSPGRVRDEAVWRRNALALADAGAAGMKAAEAKDPEAAFNAGSQMYEACFNCHARYIPRPQRRPPPLAE